MPDLEPITRDEMLWSGEDVEPITRREMYIRHLYDETQVIPDKPITREEMFILKAGEELHDVTIEQLNVSENGTYSESGKAYSPVIVDVSLPENAYLLKDIPNTPCDIATFTDGSALPMPSLKVGIEPIQSGSGDPSPTNIRPISGWDEANVSVCGVNVWDEEWEVGSISDASGQDATNNNYRRSKNYISVKANKKYYFNVPSKYGTTYRFYQYKQNKDYIGIKTVDSDGTFETDNDCAFIRFRIATTEDYTNDISINYPSTDTTYHAYNGQTYTIDLDGTRYGIDIDVINGIGREYKEYPSYNGETLIGPWISDRDVYAEGTTPTIGAQVLDKGDITTFNTTPTAVKSLRGVNNLFADCGQVQELSYFSKEV